MRNDPHAQMSSWAKVRARQPRTHTSEDTPRLLRRGHVCTRGPSCVYQLFRWHGPSLIVHVRKRVDANCWLTCAGHKTRVRCTNSDSDVGVLEVLLGLNVRILREIILYMFVLSFFQSKMWKILWNLVKVIVSLRIVFMWVNLVVTCQYSDNYKTTLIWMVDRMGCVQ